MDPEKKEKKFEGKRGPRKEAKRGKDSKLFKGKKVDEPIYKQGPNDPVWRTNDKVMTELVAKLPFGIAAGLPQTMITDDIAKTEEKFVQPGILSVRVYVTPGSATDYNSAFNLAVRKIYSYVRHANSGSRQYEGSDMGMFFIATGQAIACLGWLQRLYRTLTEYSPTNRYTPKALVELMGVNFDDAISNLPRIKYLIAWLGRVISGLAFPALHFFDACYSAFKHVYRDNDSPKEQYYMLNPVAFGKYTPTYDSNGGGVHYASGFVIPTVYQTALTVNDIYNGIKGLTDVLLGDEDVGIISGDILKASKYEGASMQLWKPEAWQLDYDLIMHSPEVLQQIHNANVVNFTDISFAGYKQDPGGTGSAPFVKHDIGGNPVLSNSKSYAQNFIIDAFSKTPTPEEVVNCSVLNVQYKIKSYGGTPTTYGIDPATLVFDLFLPTDIEFAFVTTNLSNMRKERYADRFDRKYNPSLTANTLRITNFDWHPLMIFAESTGPSSYIPVVCGDIQNFGVFAYEVGQRVHENSTLGLFNFQDVNFIGR